MLLRKHSTLTIAILPQILLNRPWAQQTFFEFYARNSDMIESISVYYTIYNFMKSTTRSYTCWDGIPVAKLATTERNNKTRKSHWAYPHSFSQKPSCKLFSLYSTSKVCDTNSSKQTQLSQYVPLSIKIWTNIVVFPVCGHATVCHTTVLLTDELCTLSVQPA